MKMRPDALTSGALELIDSAGVEHRQQLRDAGLPSSLVPRRAPYESSAVEHRASRPSRRPVVCLVRRSSRGARVT